MKKFLLQIVLLALLFAIAFLGWRVADLTEKNHVLRETVGQLESERRELEQKAAASGRTPKPEEQDDARRLIEQQTSELRGLSFKQPVNYKIIDRSELRQVLQQKVREVYSAQELRDYGRSLATLGLVPENTDLQDVIVGLYDEQVAAFYVPEERALYTFKDATFSGNLDRVTLAHELTHVLQDQNFDLTKFPLKVKDDDDLALATSALVEGDATVLMTQYYGQHLDAGNVLGDLLGGVLGQDTAKFQAAPPYLREMMLFPYQEGAEFAMAVYLSGGNEALNEAFRHPPTSTKQILHPEKFLHNRRDPEAIELKKIDAKDWQMIGNNVLGAERAAQGWNGDRYHIYERGTNGPTLMLWTTAWDSEQDAEEFETAYNELVQRRGVAAQVQRDGDRVRIRQSSDAAVMQSEPGRES
jgi:hypothetical protein